MTFHRWMTAALLASAAAAPQAQAQEPDRMVAVHAGGRDGQGILRRRGDECFVITADHVVRSPRDSLRRAPHAIRIVAARGERIHSTFDYAFPSDIAVLRVDSTSENTAPRCDAWPRVRPFESLRSARNEEVVIKYREAQGNAREVRASVVGDPPTRDKFEIQPIGDSIGNGMSGSLVFINGRAAGILLETRNQGRVGIVQRLDRVEAELEPYLRERFPPSRAAIRWSFLVPGSGQSATWGREYGLLWMGVTASLGTYFLLDRETVTRTEVIDDAFGNPRVYTYQERDYPLQWYAPAVWVLSGAASALVSELYVRHNYSPGKDDPAAPPRTSLRIVPHPVLVDGEPALALTLELSF